MQQQYVVTRARSRSPSPCLHNLKDDETHKEEDAEKQERCNHLQVDQGESRRSRSRRRSRASSWNQPVDIQATVVPNEPEDPNASSELLIKPRGATGTEPALREMDDMAGAIRNYGSFSSEPGNVNNGDGHAEGHESSKGKDGNLRSARLQRQKSYYTPAMVDELRKRNKLYFLDPITKLLNFHGFPWKLTLQIIKLVLITIQVVIFGGQRENIVEYFERSDLTYKHLLLKDWSPAFETLPYPPASGDYAIYSMPNLFEHMNFVMEQYYKLPERSLATIHLNREKTAPRHVYPIELCFTANSFVEYENGTYIVSADVMHNCTFVEPTGEPGNETFDIKGDLKRQNFTVPFNRTLSISLRFFIQTFHLNLLETHYGPTCYNMSIKVSFQNFI
ncbi:unnamed protein product [Lymnaea stagnalis]|uniref:Mucolipin extracytosolic domain-containing protein n=1 Tax=Lymnaea stagnalis TaxID=6523 RepID=A0AAV2IMS6_LYMST